MTQSKSSKINADDDREREITQPEEFFPRKKANDSYSVPTKFNDFKRTYKR